MLTDAIQDEMAASLECDSLRYLPIESVVRARGSAAYPASETFCTWLRGMCCGPLRPRLLGLPLPKKAALAGALQKALQAVTGKVHDLRRAWQRKAAPENKRREALEASEGLMRVVLRAWREAADGDGVRRVGHGALGHRLTFATGKSRWHDEPGPGRELSGSWQMRVLAGGMVPAGAGDDAPG